MVEGGREGGKDGTREGEGGMAAGGGGSSGAGKETAGATTLSDLNNFQFQEGKRELEKYRRCDLADGREEAPKGSRVCDGASLDTAKKAENASGGERGRQSVARRAPQKAAFAGRGGRPSARSVEAEGPAGARRPPPTSEPGWSPPPQAGRTRLSPRSAPATSRLHPQHRRATTGRPQGSSPLAT